MREHKFKVGDKVRYTSQDHLYGVSVGEVYTVTKLDDNTSRHTVRHIQVEGIDFWFMDERFELVERAPEQKQPEPPFRVGDKVKCVDDNGSSLEAGRVYTVTKLYEDDACVCVDGVDFGWGSHRFTLVTSPTAQDEKFEQLKQDVNGALKKWEQDLQIQIERWRSEAKDVLNATTHRDNAINVAFERIEKLEKSLHKVECNSTNVNAHLDLKTVVGDVLQRLTKLEQPKPELPQQSVSNVRAVFRVPARSSVAADCYGLVVSNNGDTNLLVRVSGAEEAAQPDQDEDDDSDELDSDRADLERDLIRMGFVWFCLAEVYNWALDTSAKAWSFTKEWVGPISLALFIFVGAYLSGYSDAKNRYAQPVQNVAPVSSSTKWL